MATKTSGPAKNRNGATKVKASPKKQPSQTKAKRGRKPKLLPAYDGPKFKMVSSQPRRIPLDKLNVDDTTFQIRAVTRPEALVESIRSHGVLDPLIARPHPRKKGQLQLVSGFNRAIAAKLAGLDSVPVIVKKMEDAAACIYAFAENQNRQSLDDLDRANAIRKLKESGQAKTTSDVAKLFRLGERQVRNLEALLTYPEELRAAVADKASGVTATHALVMAQAMKRVAEESARHGWIRKWVDCVRSEKLSVVDLKKRLRADRAQAGQNVYIRRQGATTIINMRRLEGASRELKDDVIGQLQKMIEKLRG
jgi:ParB/RepB/Spo0J family partition protein